MVHVYVLFSKAFNRIYVGLTINMEKRLHEHNTGQNKSTKAYVPWVKVYHEDFSTRAEARKREKYLKSYRGRTWIRKYLIENKVVQK